MKKLFKVLAAYFIYAIIVGEIVVRMLALTSDVPQRTIAEDNMQKYLPNQKGLFGKGAHQWQINERGWAGELPENYDNLITIIGDSFIENFMNPDECHQAIYLKKHFPDNNFLEAGRSGVSFIEAMEISKHLDSLNPKYHIIYLGDFDFEESISSIARKPDLTQLDLDKGQVLHGRLKAPILKKILYNWKFLYYVYNRFPLNFNKNKSTNSETPKVKSTPTIETHELAFEKLVQYVVRNYEIEDKILVLKPIATKKLGQLLSKYGFKVITLDNKNEEWTFVYDRHWTCFGHEEASKQIAKTLASLNL